MTLTPLRTAFWALATGIGLSLSLLAVGYFPGSAQVPPTASLHAMQDSDGIVTTEDTLANSRLNDPLAPELPPADGAEADSPASVGPDPSLVPVNVVSRSAGDGLAIGLEEALRPSHGSGEFYELPPPPEFEAPLLADAASPPIGPELDELLGRVQTNFDGLHTEFDRLHVEFVGLQDHFSRELSEVRSAHGDLQRTLSDLAEATASRDRTPPPLACDVAVLLLPLRGDARHGALPLVARNARNISLSMLPEFAEGTRCAISDCDSATLSGWLQDHGQATVREHSALHVEQQAIVRIDLAASLTPGMLQARGAEARERSLALPWDGFLAFRGSSTPSGLLVVEVRVDSSSADHGWTRATVTPGGALIVTALLDEIQRPVNGLSSAPSQQPTGERQPAATQMIVLLQPRLLTTSLSESARSAGGLVPIPSDESKTR